MEPPERRQPGGKKSVVSPLTSDAERGRHASRQQAFQQVKASGRNNDSIVDDIKRKARNIEFEFQTRQPSRRAASQSEAGRDPVFDRHLVQHDRLRVKERQPQRSIPATRNDPDSPRRTLSN